MRPVRVSNYLTRASTRVQLLGARARSTRFNGRKSVEKCLFSPGSHLARPNKISNGKENKSLRIRSVYFVGLRKYPGIRVPDARVFDRIERLNIAQPIVSSRALVLRFFRADLQPLPFPLSSFHEKFSNEILILIPAILYTEFRYVILLEIFQQ